MSITALRRLVDDATAWAPPRPPLHDARASGWPMPPAISEEEMRTAHLTPRPIVPGYIYADVGVLVAPGGTSKTTMSLHEAVCIVLQRRLWGLEVTAPGPVLIVTAEDRREYLVARLRRICEAQGLSAAEVARVREMVLIHDCTAALRRLTAVSADVVVPTNFAADIVNTCKAEGMQPALVQFDPLVSFGVGESRVNDAEQGLIHAARIIVAGLDCAVRFVHHTGQAKARDNDGSQYAGRGGSALSDGCRMVHVLTRLDDDTLYKATGERLGEDESAFAIMRPKISHAPPQTAPLYVRRRGYRFDLLRELEPQTSGERAAAIGNQLARFLAAELGEGRRHSRNTLEQLRPENLGRADVRQGLAWLTAHGRLQDTPVIDEAGKRPAVGARSYLTATGEPSPAETA